MKNQTINRKSFIIHADSLDILDQLTDEQAGKLFKAISCYQKTGEISQVDQLVKIAITPFINQFKRDEEKYLNIVERNKINISKRWSKDTTGKIGIPKDTKNTDNDSKSDSDSDSKNKNKKDSKNELPIFINKNLLDDFAEVRKKLKKPLTEKAKELVVKKLIEFESKQSGFANLALENSIENSWQGVFEPKNTSPNRPDSLAAKLNSIAGGDYFKSITLGDKAILNCNVGMKTKLYSLPEEIRQKIKDQFKQPIEIN